LIGTAAWELLRHHDHHRLPGQPHPFDVGSSVAHLVADGREHLFACLDNDGESVIQAIWTQSPHVAFLVHTGLLSEMVLDAVLLRLEDDPVREILMAELKRFSYCEENDLPGRIEVQRVPGQTIQTILVP
jgi:hypothetical protein